MSLPGCQRHDDHPGATDRSLRPRIHRNQHPGPGKNWVLGKVKPDPKIEFQHILQKVGGGAHKRVDENRELLELQQDKAPEMLRANPWAMAWIQRNDKVFEEMAELAIQLELATAYGRD